MNVLDNLEVLRSTISSWQTLGTERQRYRAVKEATRVLQQWPDKDRQAGAKTLSACAHRWGGVALIWGFGSVEVIAFLEGDGLAEVVVSYQAAVSMMQRGYLWGSASELASEIACVIAIARANEANKVLQ